MDDDISVEIDMKAVKIEEKIAAVLVCLSNSGYTLRTLRDCASKYAPVSEHMVKKIILKLQKMNMVKYDTKARRWYLSNDVRFNDIQNALRFVQENRANLL